MNVPHVNNNETYYDQCWSDEIPWYILKVKFSKEIGEIPRQVELRVRH